MSSLNTLQAKVGRIVDSNGKDYGQAIFLYIKYNYFKETLVQKVPLKYGMPSNIKEAVHFALQQCCAVLENYSSHVHQQFVENHRKKRKLFNEWFHEDLTHLKLEVLPE